MSSFTNNNHFGYESACSSFLSNREMAKEIQPSATVPRPIHKNAGGYSLFKNFNAQQKLKKLMPVTKNTIVQEIPGSISGSLIT